MPLSDARESDEAGSAVTGRPRSAKRSHDEGSAQSQRRETSAVSDTVWQFADRWLRRSLEVITDSAGALDELNVFPVADADTGANLCLTFRAIDRSVAQLDAGTVPTVTATAIRSAHGNSGAIVAEMLSAAAEFGLSAEHVAGRGLADLMEATSTGATQAVARPVDGTILSVARAAADGARTAAPGDPLTVAEAARAAAGSELASTVDQLPALQQARVVDSGGQAYVLLLDVLVETLGGTPARTLSPASEFQPKDGAGVPATAPSAAAAAAVAAPAGATKWSTSTPGDEYEVMYTVRGADREALGTLRHTLDSIGNSVVVVGDQTVAQVHVHLPDAGAAIQPALGLGELSQIKITTLRAEDRPRPRRTVISIVAGRGLADTVEADGGTAVPIAAAPENAAALAELLAADTEEVIILPNDMEQLEIAHLLSREATGDSRRVSVIPTVAQAQGLAALAVHDATADFDDAVSTMNEAAFGTRHGAITIAETPVRTMVGRCAVGDVLGVADGDICHIGSDLADVGWQVIGDLIGGDAASVGPEADGSRTALPAELLTLIIGADGSVDLAHDLAERVRAHYPGVEVWVLCGGQDRYPMLIGVE